MSVAHGLLLIGLLSILAGRFLEQLVGVARVSDLTVFWVLLGLFAASATVMRYPGQSSEVTSGVHPMPQHKAQLLSRLVLVGCVVGAIGFTTWVKTINYPRAAVIVANGLQHSREGDFDAALYSFERAVELAPDVWINHNRKAAVYSAFRGGEQLPQELGCGLQGQAVAQELCLARQAYLDDLVGVEQRPLNFRSVNALAVSTFELAMLTGDKGLEREAFEYFREVAALIPISWQVHNGLAAAYLLAEQPRAAFEPLERSLIMTGDTSFSARAYLLRGIAYRKLGEPLKAIGEFGEAVVRLEDENVYEAYNQRGFSYWVVGQQWRAIEDWTAAIHSNLKSGESYLNRGLAYRQLGLPKLAVLDLDQAEGLDPLDPLSHNNRGLAYADLGDYERSIEDYSEAIRLDLQYAQAYVNRGDAYGQIGLFQRSMQDSEEAILLDPDNAAAYALRATAYTGLGRDEEAEKDVDRAVELGFDASALRGLINELKAQR